MVLRIGMSIGERGLLRGQSENSIDMARVRTPVKKIITRKNARVAVRIVLDRVPKGYEVLLL